VSNGGVHGMLSHMLAAVPAHRRRGRARRRPRHHRRARRGPDLGPRLLAELEAGLPPGARIATVLGRYYAMDRDNRWERVKAAYDALTRAEGLRARDAGWAVDLATERGETDEFIQPTVLDGHEGLRPGDGSSASTSAPTARERSWRPSPTPDFRAWDRGEAPPLAARLGMVDYSERHDAWYATPFPSRTSATRWASGSRPRACASSASPRPRSIRTSPSS
jgi:2,3-bisphosphoglycerate-independent phosphoglycerate mutase